jgi:NAD(P)H dehydrogenase (quinone)
MKNVLLILGHPSKNSFNATLLDAYKNGAAAVGAEVKTIFIGELNFNPNLQEEYKNREENVLEEDLKEAQSKISWASHVVLVYPTWWGSLPALAKGFIDRVFLPGFAFKYHKGKAFPEKLLKGKSIRVISTMDTPKFWFNLVYGRAQYKMLKQLVFEYVGFSPVRFTTIGGVRTNTPADRQKWIDQIFKMGLKLM